jgi:hypothetical protein
VSETVRRDAWRDKASTPTTYNGRQFRSVLEADVARFLDECAVHWRYEVWTDYTRRYLPDFTIDWAADYLNLPRWVEVKPQEMLYDLRDALGVPELFQGEWRVEGVSAGGILNLNAKFVELYKPKRLTEVAADDLLQKTPLSTAQMRSREGIGVLVTAVANRTRTLSVEMDACGVTFSRSHPFVNRKGALRDAERAAERERWRLESEERDRQYAANQARYQAEAAELRRQREEFSRRFLAHVAVTSGRRAKYPGKCRACAGKFPAEELWMWNFDGEWVVLCDGDEARTR